MWHDMTSTLITIRPYLYRRPSHDLCFVRYYSTPCWRRLNVKNTARPAEFFVAGFFPFLRRYGIVFVRSYEFVSCRPHGVLSRYYYSTRPSILRGWNKSNNSPVDLLVIVFFCLRIVLDNRFKTGFNWWTVFISERCLFKFWTRVNNIRVMRYSFRGPVPIN